MLTILTPAMTSWPMEEYHEVRDEGKTWVALDVLLVMALQHAIDRSQRGNRLDSLLFEFLLDRRGTPVLAALYQRPAQLDDALFNPLRDLTRLVPRLGAQSLCPFRIISLVARFPFIEPAF